MRLLSFLTDIERAIRLEANAAEGTVWDATRIVNFKTGLARLTLTSRDTENGMPQGFLLVQHFALANGSFCLKVSLNWQGSAATPIISVYDTPVLNWKLEASRIASGWLSGPPAAAEAVPISSPEERVAVAS
jgi:hypothetical protein